MDEVQREKPERGAQLVPHAAWEDVQGIVASVLLIAFAIGLFQKLGLITSGIAGLSIVIHYATGWQTGLVFFFLNLPFYGLALWRLGVRFALKTLAAAALLALLVDMEPNLIVFERVNPVFGALLGGVLMGFGLLGVFRHRASVGGLGILAVLLQDRFGIRAGVTLLLFDLVLFALALLVAPVQLVGISVLGAVILNVFLAVNHRTDRYIAG